jgi:hypothetical protein
MYKGSASGLSVAGSRAMPQTPTSAADAHELCQSWLWSTVDDGGGGVVAAFVVDPALLLEHCASTQHGHLPDTQLVLIPTDSLQFWLLSTTLIGEINAKHDSASFAAASSAASTTSALY